MCRKIAVGVIVYKAEQETLNRLKQAVSSGFDVYLYDNSPDEYSAKEFSKTCEKIKYYTCGKNAGLGIGLSTICAQAYSDNIEALLFFDQDTVFNVETLEFVDDYYLHRKSLRDSHSSLFFNAKHKKDNETQPDGVLDIDLTINSGSLYFLKNLKSIGWHDLTYFVDGVDYKYCLDSKAAGFKIGECSYTPGFDHVSEQADKVYNVFNKKYYLRAYPLFRMVDTIKSSLRLAVTALGRKEWKLSNSIVRMLSIYLVCQCIVRVINFKEQIKNESVFRK